MIGTLRPAAWAVALAAACAVFAPLYGVALWPRPAAMQDFFQEYASARFYFEGRPVYSPLKPVIAPYTGETGRLKGIVLEVNAHPPTAVLLALPLAGLDYADAFRLWNALSIAALAGTAALIAGQFGLKPTWRWLVPGALALLLCYPLRFQLEHGQLNLLLLFLLTGTWAADRSGRPWLAGALLGLAAATKLYPLFLLLPLMLAGRWRVVASAVLWFAGLNALTAAVLGVGAFQDYVTRVMPHVRVYYSNPHNVSLTGFWFNVRDVLGRLAQRWLSPQRVNWAAMISSLILVAVVARAAWRARTLEGRDRAFALGVAALPLLSPISWCHGFLLLLLPAAVVYRQNAVRRFAFWVVLGLLFLPHYELWGALGLTASRVTALTIPAYMLGLFGLFTLGCYPAFQLDPVPEPRRQPRPEPIEVEEPEAVAVA